MNSALHVQGTLELAWETFADPGVSGIEMRPLLLSLGADERQAIADRCECGWTVTWAPDVCLRRLTEGAEVLRRFRTVYEGLHQKDLETYLERIKSLETRIRALEQGGGFAEMIGDSPAMRTVFDTIRHVADSDLTVLIRGESGTGKELAARAIHDRSDRRDGPFIAVNCAAFSEGVLESELFGHEKGAFTGAHRTKPGRFEMANVGTLFLDEVGDIPLVTQVKLLRALETRTFERVGGTTPIEVDVRIIGATHRDLEAMMAEGGFREDFYFRLDVLTLRIPPLRERREDIPLLAQHFLETAAKRSKRSVHGISRGAMDRLMNHAWPGNIRDLHNAIQRAVVVYASGDVLTESDVGKALGIREHQSPQGPVNLRQRDLLLAIRKAGRCTIDDLAGSGAGTETGWSRRTFQNDVRALTGQGYLAWHKQGSARTYELTPQGIRALAGFGDPAG